MRLIFSRTLLSLSAIACNGNKETEELPSCTISPTEITAMAMTPVVFTAECPQPMFDYSWNQIEDTVSDITGFSSMDGTMTFVMPALPGTYEVYVKAMAYDVQATATVTVTPDIVELDDRVRFRTGFLHDALPYKMITWLGHDEVLFIDNFGAIKTLRTDNFSPGTGLSGVFFLFDSPSLSPDGKYLAGAGGVMSDVPLEHARSYTDTLYNLEEGILERQFQSYHGVPSRWGGALWDPTGNTLGFLTEGAILADIDEELPYLTVLEGADENGNATIESTNWRGGDSVPENMSGGDSHAFSFDGDRYVTLGAQWFYDSGVLDGLADHVHVWDVETGALLMEKCIACDDQIAETRDISGREITWTPDNTIIVATDYGLMELDSNTGEKLALIEELQGINSPDQVSDLVWSWDQSTLYIVSKAQPSSPDIDYAGVYYPIIAFDWASRSILWQIDNRQDMPDASARTRNVNITVLEDERLLAWMKGDLESPLYLIDPETGEREQLDVISSPVIYTRYNQDGTHLLAVVEYNSGYARDVRMFDASTGEQLWTRTDALWGAWDGNQAVLSTQVDSFSPVMLEWITPETGEVQSSLEGGGAYFALSPNGAEFTTGGYGTLRRFSITTGEQLDGWVSCPVAPPYEYLNGGYLAGDGAICASDGSTVSERQEAEITTSGDGAWVAYADGNTVHMKDPSGGRSRTVTFERDVDCIALNIDGSVLLAQMTNVPEAAPAWLMMDTKTGNQNDLFTAPYQVSECNSLHWRPNRAEVAAGTWSELITFELTPSDLR